jgi:RNA polymerase sigma-70 factor (ECF subfamily)
MPESALLSDSDLAARIRKRDREALAAVVDTYLDQIVRAARGAGLTHHQAEEVAQNTFATFIETAPRFEGRSHVRTWIFGILYRKIQESRRGFAKDRRMDDIDEVFESRFDQDRSWSRPPRGPEDQLFAKEAHREINDCLEGVPQRQRMAFVLREVEGLSTQEICKILEVSVTNIGVMLFRARNRLRECLENKWEHTSSP